MSEPITREEQYLNAIANGEATDLTPITREELFMARAAGQNVQVPTPITRKEMFLSKISGGSGGVSAIINPLTITKNGTYPATAYVDGYAPVVVNVKGDLAEISSSSEMNSILSNATSESVGKAYKYVGETDENYENNAIYVIKEI